MKPEEKAVKNWFIMAEIDLRAAKAINKEGIFSAVCFHAQQVVEKILKGLILYYENEVPKTHDLMLLLNKLIKHQPDFKKYKENCEFLNKFYVPTRYPDAFPGSLPEGLPNKKDASESLEKAEKIFNSTSPPF